MKPAFRITANGQDATAALASRLLSLSVTDADGETADRLEIDLDDRDGLIALPDMDATLDVALGYQGQPLAALGRFRVDGMSGSHPAQTLQITATAADLKGDIRSPKTRAFENKSLSDIAATIAGEAGLKPLVSASIAGRTWAYLAQTAESNLHFLTRIAKTLDATAKAAGGALIVQRRGDGLTAAGDPLVPPVISQRDLTEWTWDLDTREVYRCVEAEWCNVGGGQVQVVRRGDGTPLLRIRHVYPSIEEADRAADAKLQGAARAAMTINATLAGFNDALMAGATVTLTGMTRRELNGTWHLNKVIHSFSAGGLATRFVAKKGQS